MFGSLDLKSRSLKIERDTAVAVSTAVAVQGEALCLPDVVSAVGESTQKFRLH